MKKDVLKVDYKQYIAKENFRFYVISFMAEEIIFRRLIVPYLILCTFVFNTN